MTKKVLPQSIFLFSSYSNFPFPSNANFQCIFLANLDSNEILFTRFVTRNEGKKKSTPKEKSHSRLLTNDITAVLGEK